MSRQRIKGYPPIEHRGVVAVAEVDESDFNVVFFAGESEDKRRQHVVDQEDGLPGGAAIS